MSGRPTERALRCDGPLDLRATLGPLAAGAGDPTLRVGRSRALRASRTPEGPGTLEVRLGDGGRIVARGWGPGGPWLVDRAPDWLGLRAPPPELPVRDAVVSELRRRAPGVRLSRTHRVVELLVPIVLQQLVQGVEAARAHDRLVRAFSEPAPGPWEELWLPLSPAALRALAPAALPPLGVLPRQGETLRELGWRARGLEAVDALPGAEAARRLRAVRGLGPWSVGSALLRGLGDGDAVPLGDFHLPSAVAWTLAGEPRADDARMLELLAPFRPLRGWVVRWVLAAGRRPPRRGPRLPLRPVPRAPGPTRLPH